MINRLFFYKVRHWTGRVVAKASTREWPIRFGFLLVWFFTCLVFYLFGFLFVWFFTCLVFYLFGFLLLRWSIVRSWLVNILIFCCFGCLVYWFFGILLVWFFICWVLWLLFWLFGVRMYMGVEWNILKIIFSSYPKTHFYLKNLKIIY